MDAIFTKILEIEYRSREIVREAEERRDDIAERIEEEKEKLLRVIMDKEEKKLVEARGKILNNARGEAERQLSKASANIASMEQFRTQHMDEWLDRLYKRITAH